MNSTYLYLVAYLFLVLRVLIYLKTDCVFPFLQRHLKQSVWNMFISYAATALICSSSGLRKEIWLLNLWSLLHVSYGNIELLVCFYLFWSMLCLRNLINSLWKKNKVVSEKICSVYSQLYEVFQYSYKLLRL